MSACSPQDEVLLHSTSILCAAYDPESGCIITGGDDSRIQIHYMDGHVPMDGETELPTTFEGHTERVTGLAIMEDGILSSVSHDKTLRTWNLSKMKPLQVAQHWGKTISCSLIKLTQQSCVLSFDRQEIPLVIIAHNTQDIGGYCVMEDKDTLCFLSCSSVLYQI